MIWGVYYHGIVGILSWYCWYFTTVLLEFYYSIVGIFSRYWYFITVFFLYFFMVLLVFNRNTDGIFQNIAGVLQYDDTVGISSRY